MLGENGNDPNARDPESAVGTFLATKLCAKNVPPHCLAADNLSEYNRVWHASGDPEQGS